jgi:hypothetical protein
MPFLESVPSSTRELQASAEVSVSTPHHPSSRCTVYACLRSGGGSLPASADGWPLCQLVADRQLPNALAGGGEDGVAERRG